MGEIAHDRIDPRNARAAVHHALGNIAARVDAQPQEHGRARWPGIEKLPWEITPAHDRADEMRRIRNSASASARPAASISAPLPHSRAAGAGAGACELRCPLRRLSALSGGLTRRNLLDGRG